MKFQILYAYMILVILEQIQATENSFHNATSQCVIMTNDENIAVINFYQNGPNKMLFIKGILSKSFLTLPYGQKIEDKQYLLKIYEKVPYTTIDNNSICNYKAEIYNSNNLSYGDLGTISLNSNLFYLYDGNLSLYGTVDNIIGKICVLQQKIDNKENIIGCGIINSGIITELSKFNYSYSTSTVLFLLLFLLLIIL